MGNEYSQDELIQGLSALRLGLVPADRFFQVLKQWLDDSSVGLLKRFESEGLLSPDQLSLLLGTVDKLKEKFSNDLTQVFDFVAPGSSAGAIPDEVRNSDPFATLLPESSSGTSEDRKREINTSATRFRILRPHAEGGLGKVSLAHDREVNRPVAFKEIKPQFANDRESQQQFMLEAQLTGGLEHPGIVPIYGLGHHHDGRPYYAMRFVSGDSLQSAIEKLHHAENTNDRLCLETGQRMLEFRQLLGRFVDVCQAVAYAHHRGVLHRDLKPGNIMLGKYSETLVIDWGLAKLTRPESDGSGLNIELDQPLLTSGSMAASKGQGIAGTPAYMSPEQARGDLAALGAASDIFSLGATLYCLLTGRAPQDKKIGLVEVLRRVSSGEFQSPLSIKSDIPKALNAICLHAMATKPEERYSSAQLLADDIERWLADEPIAIYKEPLITRASRWARKNRIKVSLGLGALVTGLVASIIGFILVSQEQARTELQRARAEVLFRQAREAVDDYLINVTDNEQLKTKSLQPTRISLLQDGLKYYQNFLDENEGSESLKVPRARALLRLARIHKEIGSLDDAEKSFALAFAECESIFASEPRVPGLKIEYANGYLELGEIQLANTTRRDESLVSFQKAEEIINSSSAEENAESVDVVLSNTYTKLGLWYKSSDIAKSIDYARKAIDLRSKITARDSATFRDKIAWARSLFDGAILLGETRNFVEATKLLVQSREVWQSLASQAEISRDALEAEASISHEIAILADQLGNVDNAIVASEAALKSRADLVFKGGEDGLQKLSQTYNDHGLRLIRREASKVQGEELLQRALWVRRELVAASPLSSMLIVRFSETTNNICQELLKSSEAATANSKLATARSETARAESELARAESELKKAEKLLLEAKSLFDACSAETLDTPGVAKYRAATELLIGRLRQLQGSTEAADLSLKQAVEWLEKLVEADPKNPEYLLTLMLSNGTIGGIKVKASEFESAMEYYAKAVNSAAKLAELSPEDLQARQNQSAYVLNSAIAMRRASKPIEEVRIRLLEAIDLSRGVLAKNKGFVSSRKLLLTQFVQLIDTYRSDGDSEALIPVFTTSTEQDSWSAPDLVEISKRLCAILKRDPNDAANLDPSQLKYANFVVDILKQAKSIDTNIANLESIPEFELLSTLDTFKELTKR